MEVWPSPMAIARAGMLVSDPSVSLLGAMNEPRFLVMVKFCNMQMDSLICNWKPSPATQHEAQIRGGGLRRRCGFLVVIPSLAPAIGRDRKAKQSSAVGPGTAVPNRIWHGCESAASIRPGCGTRARTGQLRCQASGQARIVWVRSSALTSGFAFAGPRDQVRARRSSAADSRSG